MSTICNCECDNCEDGNCDNCLCCKNCDVCDLCLTNEGKYDIIDIDSEDELNNIFEHNINIGPCIHGYDVQIITPCCGNIYSCYICHNKKENHYVNKKDIIEFICIKCHKQQNITNKCVNCNFIFDICTICFEKHDIDNIHCKICNICHKKEFIFCDNCKVCCPKNHTCSEQCQVCLGDMENKIVLKCGHTIHEECKDYLLINTYKCPYCNKSMRDMSEEFCQIDIEISKNTMPKEMIKKIKIHCNDCLVKSYCDYHFIGLKCKKCKSYNTIKIYD
jgi:RING finger/CHY zinc finger protein 1